MSIVTEALQNLIELGGPVIALLLALSVIALAVILLKLWQFYRLGVWRGQRVEQALSAWDQGDGARALSVIRGSTHFLAPTLGQALIQTDRKMGKVPAFRDRLLSLMSAELDRLDRGLRVLETIAQIAPLLGLFGTVLGMIDAFQALQSAGSSVDPSILAGGIWVALMTTAAGLAVAMPTQVILTWLEAIADKERAEAELVLERILCPVSERDQVALQTGDFAHVPA